MVFSIIRINEYEMFRTLNKDRTWLFNSQNKWNSKKFQQSVKKGDIIWFVEGKTGGSIIAVATFNTLERLSSSAKAKLNLPETMEKVDTHIKYGKFYHLEDLELKAEVRFARDFFQVDKEKHTAIHQMLGTELGMIRRYATLKRQMP